MHACHGRMRNVCWEDMGSCLDRPTAIVTWRIATFEYLPVTNWDTTIKKKKKPFWILLIKRDYGVVWVISAIHTLRNHFVTWLRLANGSEPSAVEVCSLFGYFANLVLNSDPRSACKPPSVMDLTGFHREDAPWIRLIEIFLWTATCSSLINCKKPRVDFITWLPSPIPQRGKGKKADMFEGNVMVKKYRGGRQEGVFLKKGFTLFWIYYSTFAFLLRTRFLLLFVLLREG